MPEIVYDIIVILSLLTACFSVFLLKRCNTKERVFCYYIMANGFFELLAWFLLLIGIKNNLPGLHLYTLVQFVLITLFFNACYSELNINIRHKWILAVGVLGIIANSVFVQSIFIYNSYSISLVELYVIIMSISLFILFLRDKNHDQANMKAAVSFVTAVFLKSSVSVIIYLYSNELLTMADKYRVPIVSLKIMINYISLIIIILGLSQILIRTKGIAPESILSLSRKKIYG